MSDWPHVTTISISDEARRIFETLERVVMSYRQVVLPYSLKVLPPPGFEEVGTPFGEVEGWTPRFDHEGVPLDTWRPMKVLWYREVEKDGR